MFQQAVMLEKALRTSIKVFKVVGKYFKSRGRYGKLRQLIPMQRGRKGNVLRTRVKVTRICGTGRRLHIG